MDCTITSITRKGNKAGCAGMTLVELLMAVGISGLVFAAVSILIFFSGRSYAALANYVDLDNKSRGALDRMSKEIRQVDAVTSSGTTNLPTGQVVTNRLELSGTETNGSPYTLTYDYNPSTQTLLRTKAGGSYPGTTTLLTGCMYLNFGMYQRVPKTNSFDQFDAADLATCKVVQLDWICSRKIFNRTANTESIESARVVIRKK
jgi:prepilin-type N-terminal cleavage/methylation domain-containing protein